MASKQLTNTGVQLGDETHPLNSTSSEIIQKNPILYSLLTMSDEEFNTEYRSRENDAAANFKAQSSQHSSNESTSSTSTKTSNKRKAMANFDDQSLIEEEVYCNVTWDTILCWPATEAGVTIRLPCLPLPRLGPEKFGYRTCGPNGRWEGRFPGDTSMPIGFSNYTTCYTPESMDIYNKFFLNKPPAQAQMIKDSISAVRTMKVVGLWVSFVSCLLELFFFFYFRSLRCHRTRIHRNLFVSIIVQVFIRLLAYVDQYIARAQSGEIAGSPSGSSGAIYDTYALLEYTKTVQFMWMLIEGMYLHNQIAVSVFSKKANYVVFYSMGWGVLIPLTVAWCVTPALTNKNKRGLPVGVARPLIITVSARIRFGEKAYYRS
ncbi:PDF receptor-like [Dreissena polymorpha]|uniref:PDF receptor-like n=1 Tax=Dreissena polymorpha TaxID=45954 RepID=UPI002264C2CD|nr:PDF receptor-like [Dreissena polymorpha]